MLSTLYSIISLILIFSEEILFITTISPRLIDGFILSLKIIVGTKGSILVVNAIKNNIKIISSCGTGNKINPEALSITNIWKTYNDPLAKKFRYLLRKEGISYKLPVVSSSEVPILKTKDIIGSVSIVPNTAGIFLASYVINDILKEK